MPRPHEAQAPSTSACPVDARERLLNFLLLEAAADADVDIQNNGDLQDIQDADQERHASQGGKVATVLSSRGTIEIPDSIHFYKKYRSVKGGGDNSTVLNPTIVAVMEGRGSARGEVGIVSLSISNPTLVLSQVRL